MLISLILCAFFIAFAQTSPIKGSADNVDSSLFDLETQEPEPNSFRTLLVPVVEKQTRIIYPEVGHPYRAPKAFKCPKTSTDKYCVFVNDNNFYLCEKDGSRLCWLGLQMYTWNHQNHVCANIAVPSGKDLDLVEICVDRDDRVKVAPVAIHSSDDPIWQIKNQLRNPNLFQNLYCKWFPDDCHGG